MSWETEFREGVCTSSVVWNWAAAWCGRSRGQAVCRGARQTLTGGNRVMEARGEAATAVHHCALLRQPLQDCSTSEGRRHHSFITFLCFEL